MTPEERKARPIATGVLAYFPDAIMEVANCSFIGNQQHNPGQPLHWAKEKSTDHDDALSRHHTDRLAGQKFDTDGVRHRAKAAWRALAALQVEIEQERGIVPMPMAPTDPILDRSLLRPMDRPFKYTEPGGDDPNA